MRGWEGGREGKEEGAKTGNFAKVPKFSHLCCCSRKREDECSQGDREVERTRKSENAEEGLSFSGFKSRGSGDVETWLHIEEETSTRLRQQQRFNKDSQASVLVLWSEDRGRNRGEEGGEEKEEIGRGVFALEGGCFPYSCIWRTEEESIISDHLARLHRSIDSTVPCRDRGGKRTLWRWRDLMITVPQTRTWTNWSMSDRRTATGEDFECTLYNVLSGDYIWLSVALLFM